MKRIAFSMLFLLAAFSFTACNPYDLEATKVTIDGVTYRRGFHEDLLYPFKTNMTFWEETYTVNDKEYRRVDTNGFNLVQTDGGGTTAGRLYCAEDQWEQAEVYYADSDHYLYYCSVGVENVKKGTVPVVSEIPEVDPEKFNELIAFAEGNRYKPFGPSKDNTRRLPYPDMQKTPPFFFYKESKDGILISGRGQEFYMEDNGLVLLYRYDHSNQENKEMIVVDVPDELCEYFVAFMANYINDTASSEAGLSGMQIEDVPGLQLHYADKDGIHEVAVSPGSYSWSYEGEDGAATKEASGAHPLDAVAHMLIIENADHLSHIELRFEIQPETVAVRRWPDSYIGFEQAYEQYFETVTPSDGAIPFSGEEDGYIYEVHATWQQGNAYYAFYVK